MRTIGLLGGMSWESSAEYYRIVNTQVRERLGGLNSSKVILYSVNFAEVEKLQRLGEWDEARKLVVRGAQHLTKAGAECVVICTNTMHVMAEDVQENVNVPLIHIADATAEKIKEAGLYKVGLLGTRFTMEKEFYRTRLEKRHGLSVMTPNEVDRGEVHRVIYEELCAGKIFDSSRVIYQQIVSKLQEQGAQGIILGCTEIGLLLRPRDCEIPLFCTAKIHAEAAVKWSLS